MIFPALEPRLQLANYDLNAPVLRCARTCKDLVLLNVDQLCHMM